MLGLDLDPAGIDTSAGVYRVEAAGGRVLKLGLGSTEHGAGGTWCVAVLRCLLDEAAEPGTEAHGQQQRAAKIYEFIYDTAQPPAEDRLPSSGHAAAEVSRGRAGPAAVHAHAPDPGAGASGASLVGGAAGPVGEGNGEGEGEGEGGAAPVPVPAGCMAMELALAEMMRSAPGIDLFSGVTTQECRSVRSTMQGGTRAVLGQYYLGRC